MKDRGKLDLLTKDDYEIIRRAQQNVNWFTTHYLKSPRSGTYYRKDYPDPLRFKAWDAMRTAWKAEGSPSVYVIQNNAYQVSYDIDRDPIFFLNHGPILWGWQLQMFHAKQPEVLVIGGVGSGKTIGGALGGVALACMVPNFDGLVLAPTLEQAKQTWQYILDVTDGTPLAERWIHAQPERPYPTLTLRNDYIGESVIKIRSTEEHDMRKILTYEVDWLFVDQAEAYMNFNELRMVAGTRLRGLTHAGRPRLNKMWEIANSAANDEMWYLAEEADKNPDKVLFLAPKTSDNPFLTARDIQGFKDKMGSDMDEDVWMNAKRPIGRGDIFPANIIKLGIDESLNKLVEDGVQQGRRGFELRTAPRAGIYKWVIPPSPRRIYIVIADPGQGNPPDRNSPVIMVWDVTEFPNKPATLQAFHWVFANGNYQNFVDEYEYMVKLYRSQTLNAFDSTGIQKAFNQLVFSDRNLAAENIDMQVSNKRAAINAARYFLGKGLMKFPYISALTSQLANYKDPEPEKLAQDLVMCFCMSGWYMHRFYYEEPNEKDEARSATTIPHDRYRREGMRDRYARGGRR